MSSLYWVTFNDSGEIMGRYSSSDPLQLNNYSNVATMALAEWEAQPELYQRVHPESLTRFDKQQIIITTDVNTFSADGSESCTLTFSGIIADIQLRLTTSPTIVGTADPTLTLRSQRPRMFRIFINDFYHYSNVATVEAL